MKNIIFVAGLALAMALPAYAAEDAKPKTKKPKQNCKEVKVREKHKGTAVPEKKK